jgi:hypothetical protein
MERMQATGVSPLLDIGGDVGALVVYLAGPVPGDELQACPTGQVARRFHTGVHQWRRAEHELYVAVFPEVVAGVYDVLDEWCAPMARIEVAGGQVSEVNLR